MTDHIEIMEKDIETHVNAHLGSSAWEALKQMPKIELANRSSMITLHISGPLGTSQIDTTCRPNGSQ